MKHSTFARSAVLGTLVLACAFSPVLASAQTSWGSYSYNDGSSETPAARRERIRGYRQQSSENQAKIQALGATPVLFLPMPVLFGVPLSSISPNFGDPRSGGRTHMGEDIMAVKGTPIVSPTDAVILRTGVGETEGNYVYTANPGGEIFVYMHLDRIGEGVVSGLVVKKGSLIGYVGDTGNALGGPAHLHFEVHNASNTPVDPFPRLTQELTPAEKIADLTTILSQNSNAQALADFLVINFRTTFTSAIASGVIMPAQISAALLAIPAGTVPATSAASRLPTGDMDVGSAGAAVVSLQTYLIQANKGTASVSLKKAGATGNFGPITKSALAEFQLSVGLAPADGYYGPATLAYISSHPIADATPVATTPPPTGTSVALYRDLKLGMTGEDVRTLQKILNARGYAVAATGSGSVGNETTYFGPATQAAVIRFQTALSISPTAGYVGPLTRTALGTV